MYSRRNTTEYYTTKKRLPEALGKNVLSVDTPIRKHT